MSKQKIDKSKVMVGSDFEMLIVDENGKMISAIPYLKGTKDKPEKTERDGCCTQHDGVLFEVNVPPTKLGDVDTFIDNVNFIKNYAKDHCLDKGQKLMCCATAEFDADQLLDPEASQIGCSADYNAWRDGDINEKPDSFPGAMRSTGTHFHFSFPDSNVDKCINLMKIYDLMVTVPFILLDPDRKRRELYGQAGAFRLQNWGDVQGFEARTLSGYCVDNIEFIRYAFNQFDKMFDWYNNHDIKEIDEDASKIIDCINNYDVELAHELCAKYEINILLQTEYDVKPEYHYEY